MFFLFKICETTRFFFPSKSPGARAIQLKLDVVQVGSGSGRNKTCLKLEPLYIAVYEWYTLHPKCSMYGIYIYIHLHLGKKMHHPLGFNWYPGLESAVYEWYTSKLIYIYRCISCKSCIRFYDCRERERDKPQNLHQRNKNK